MGMLLKQLFSFIRLLNSDTGNISLAMGVTCGFILGMTPTLSLHALLVFLIIFFFRIQVGAALVAAFFFKFTAFLLDPLFHAVGRWALQAPTWHELYTSLYNMPLIPYTRFNNSIVMGSAIITFVLAPFIFILSQIMIIKYREVVVVRFQASNFWKAIKATSFYKWYYKYNEYHWH